ncbi:MAG: UDP-N-acetylglucosamine 4,6-dehydratase (inverting) [Parachlamydiaceae bacterium]|nr:UDP-N-acetylglucosamine 4,6-dehydratase (inverting) [Parachlamydiaceae bacterium]
MPKSLFQDKVVLITGGTGSFGQAFAKRLLNEDQCQKVIIFSRDELKQWELLQSDPIFNSSKSRFFLGDVRDSDRLRRAFHEVNFIVHAAALKQVPAAEYNPTECIKTNIMGAMNIVDVAIDLGIEKVIALSTDKAVNPVNLYGATKLCSDKLFCAGNIYVGARRKPQFSVVRYGNVLGSRGSLLPLWQKLLIQGVTSLPVTDIRMTRFWITLDQAVDLVISCFKDMQGGEIFVPKIPSMKVVDLAEAIAPGMPLEITGIRPGEKLHELMISVEDSRHTLEFDNYYAILPESAPWDASYMTKFLAGRRERHLPDNFAYASDTNTEWLDANKLRSLIKKPS